MRRLAIGKTPRQLTRPLTRYGLVAGWVVGRHVGVADASHLSRISGSSRLRSKDTVGDKLE
jgi:hypothetical protein